MNDRIDMPIFTLLTQVLVMEDYYGNESAK